MQRFELLGLLTGMPDIFTKRLALPASVLLASCLLGCATEPEEQYRLTAEQLAWQGYQPGQTLRFANRSTAAMRTYQVVQVVNELIKSGKRSSLWPWSTKGTYAIENHYAMVQRTDTTAARQIMVCDIAPNMNGDPRTANLTLDWDGLPIEALLPIECLNGTLAFDSTAYAATLLPSLLVGPTTYTQVVRLTRVQYQGSSPTVTLYYAKGKGVVAFTEAKTGFWYRLP